MIWADYSGHWFGWSCIGMSLGICDTLCLVSRLITPNKAPSKKNTCPEKNIERRGNSILVSSTVVYAFITVKLVSSSGAATYAIVISQGICGVCDIYPSIIIFLVLFCT